MDRNPCRCALDHRLGEIVSASRLSVDQAQNQLVVLFKQPWRFDQVRRFYCIEDVGDRYRSFQQFRCVRRDLKFGFLAALDNHCRHAAHSIQTRRNLVRCHLPELRLRNFVRCQAVTHDRERSERQPMALDLGSRREFGCNLGERCVNQLECLEHVHLPVKEKVDLGRAPAGDGANGFQSLDAVDRLLHGARNRHHHLVNRHHSVVNADHDSRKIRGRKHSDRNRESLVGAHDCNDNDHEDNGYRVMDEPPARPGATASFIVPGIRSLSHAGQSFSLVAPASPLAGVGFSTLTLVLSGNP